MIIEFFVYALVAGAAIAALAYFGDRHEKEPLFRIFTAIILGITSTLIVVTAKKLFSFPDYAPLASWGNTILVSFVSAGLLEESAKLLMILFFIYKWADFNEFYDGPLYAGLVGIGFAITENLGYMLKPLANIIASNISVDANFLRLIGLNILMKYRIFSGHFLFGFIAGYFIAKARFKKEEGAQVGEKIYIWTGFVVAWFLHGTFNTVAIMGPYMTFLGYVLILVIICIFVGRACLRKSVFKKEILESLPDKKRNRLMAILVASKQEGVTFGYVFFLAVAILVYQVIVFFLTYFISIL